MNERPEEDHEDGRGRRRAQGAGLGRQLAASRWAPPRSARSTRPSAYATFANDGVARRQPRGASEVRDAKRQDHLQGQARGEAGGRAPTSPATSPTRCPTWSSSGTGRTVQTLNRPVAGKTGTKVPTPRTTSSTPPGSSAYTKQISTAVMYVAGDGGNADLDDVRPARRQHLLRRHLSGADLGRLHGRRPPRASRSRSSTARVRQPGPPTPEPHRDQSEPTNADRGADRDRRADPEPTRADAVPRSRRAQRAPSRADRRSRPTEPEQAEDAAADPDAVAEAVRASRRTPTPGGDG